MFATLSHLLLAARRLSPATSQTTDDLSKCGSLLLHEVVHMQPIDQLFSLPEYFASLRLCIRSYTSTSRSMYCSRLSPGLLLLFARVRWALMVMSSVIRSFASEYFFYRCGLAPSGTTCCLQAAGAVTYPVNVQPKKTHTNGR